MMRLSIAALGACAAAVQAFQDTSPFLLFSSSPLPKELEQASKAQLQSSAEVFRTTQSFLKGCPSELYYIITQPSLTASDLASSSSIPHLKKALSNPGVKTRFSVSEVVGLREVTVQSLLEEIEAQCGEILSFSATATFDVQKPLREGKKVAVYDAFGDLPPAKRVREEELADNDANMYTKILKDLAKGYKYTVIYISTPASALIQTSDQGDAYEAEFPALAHLDLKRNFRLREANSSLNGTDFRPLFEKYQFLTPGLFMGLLVAVLLLAILSVGISAVASLQVSYGAFDKEMGPAAQKKQQ